MSLMTIVVCVSIAAIALWVLFAHRRRYGSARGGATLGIAAAAVSESSSYNNGSIEDGNGGVNNECLCRKCGAAALASVAVSEQSGWSGAFAEATLRRKRMWMAQRGEEFLRNVMFGRRSAGLGPLPGARCRQCHNRLSFADHPSPSPPVTKKLKVDQGNSHHTISATPQDELQFALDLADAMVETQQRKASLQRHTTTYSGPKQAKD